MKHVTFEQSRDYKDEMSKWLYLNIHRRHKKMLNRHKARKNRK